MAANPQLSSLVSISKHRDSNAVMLENASRELVFAVVGYAGSGTSYIAEALENLLKQNGDGQSFDVGILKARDVILKWAANTGRAVPRKDGKLSYVDALQDLGDEMRSAVTADGTEDHAAVARALALRIRQLRAKKTGVDAAELLRLPLGSFAGVQAVCSGPFTPLSMRTAASDSDST